MGICKMGDLELNPLDACGCSVCPHLVIGPATSGSENTMVNGLGALRSQGVDGGVHCCCCGSNTWRTNQGSPNVFINGIPAVRLADMNNCCGGGPAMMITCAQNTFTNW